MHIFKGNLLPVLSFCFCGLIALPGIAQSTWVKDGVESTEFIIEKERENQLPEALRSFDKINFSTKSPNRRLEYKIYPVAPYKLGDVSITTSPVNMRIAPLKEGLPNYVKAGFGNYATPYAELFLTGAQEATWQYDARLRHLSSQRGAVNDEFSATMDNIVEGGLKYQGESFVAEARLEYERNRFYFYGFQPETAPTTSLEERRQVFNDLAVYTKLSSTDTKSPFYWKAQLGGRYFSDALEVRESQLEIPLEMAYKLSEQHQFRVNAEAYLMQYQQVAGKQGRSFVGLGAAYAFRQGDFIAQLGGRFVYQNDSSSALRQANFYPQIELSYRVAYDFTLFAGLQGDMQRNTYRQMARENFWMGQGIALLNTDKPLEFYGGIRGNISPQVNFSAQASYASLRNMHFFINAVPDTSRFQVIYNTQSTGLLHLNTELQVSISEQWRSKLQAQFFNYVFEADSQEAAWHRPTWALNLLSTYHWQNKLFLNADIQALGGIETQNFVSGERQTLPTIFDLSLKADYWFLEKFSAFLAGNNLLSQNYQRYLYYPVRGANFLIGITYSF
jgi:hypothetical protein